MLLARVAGPITPVVADHLVELDTPGGLDTSMREISQSSLNAPVPVVVYVSPSGARAASAGAIITFSEVKDVELPDVMRRAMASQAEAERDRRAKVIHAHGEMEAAETLGEAAVVLERHPAVMQLRVLSTMAEVSAERNSTLIFPLPIELLRLVDTMRGLNGAITDGSGSSSAGRAPAAPATPEDENPAAA